MTKNSLTIKEILELDSMLMEWYDPAQPEGWAKARNHLRAEIRAELEKKCQPDKQDHTEDKLGMIKPKGSFAKLMEIDKQELGEISFKKILVDKWDVEPNLKPFKQECKCSCHALGENYPCENPNCQPDRRNK